MEFFGVTLYGFPDVFKDMVRSDYVEPLKPQNLLKLSEEGKMKKPFSELIQELDCYSGFADGYAYKSVNRLKRLRFKGVFKPVGPTEMYKYPGATSMDYGWWSCDPYIACSTDNWYKPKHHPILTSEMSRYVNSCLIIDKYFNL